jgi:hypothetical protein
MTPAIRATDSADEFMHRPSQMRLAQWGEPIQILALWIESMIRSAYAFRLGLLGGNRSASTPPLFIAARTLARVQ